MLAAVLASPRGAAGARELLREIGQAAGLGGGGELVGDGGVAMVWDGPQPTGFDPGVGCAWLGSLRGAISAGEVEPLSGVAGAYSLVWFREGRAILARGRFGGCPLYYGPDRDGTLVVCSRLAPLLSALNRTPSIDRRRLAAVVLTSTFRGPRPHGVRGSVEGPERRGPACRGDPSAADAASPPPSATRCANSRGGGRGAEGARLLRVVARVTEGVAPAWACSLAEGSIRVPFSPPRSPSRGARLLATYSRSQSMSGGEGDDRPHMSELARSLGIEPLRLSPEDLAVAGPPTIAIDGAPFPWPTGDAIIGLMRRASSLGVDTVLTGTYGDDVFGGDLRTFAALARSGHPIRGIAAAASLKGTWLQSSSARTDALFLRPLVSRMVPLAAWRFARKLRWAMVPFWAGPLLREVHAEQGAALTDAGGDTDADILSGFARHKLLDGPAYHVDQSDYRGQLEVLTGCRRVDVLLDEEVVDFAGALPAPFLFHGGFHRGLLREAMKGLAPDSVRFRPDKASATVLVRALYGAPGRAEAIEPLQSMRALDELGLADRARSVRVFSRMYRGSWTALSVGCKFGPQSWRRGFAQRVLAGTGCSRQSSRVTDFPLKDVVVSRSDRQVRWL